jgi:hypothetical protein
VREPAGPRLVEVADRRKLDAVQAAQNRDVLLGYPAGPDHSHAHGPSLLACAAIETRMGSGLVTAVAARAEASGALKP